MSSQKMALGFLTLSMSLSLSLARPALNSPAQANPQPPKLPQVAASVPGPKIEFADKTHDFGHAKSGEPVRYTYYFTNSGDQVLEITHVQPSCGCTTAGDYSKRVEPGQTGRIPIQFNTANFSGQVFKTIAVTSTARNENTVVLQLHGTVWKPIEFIPAYSVLSIPPDAPGASAVVRITNNLEEPLVLFDPHVTNPAFTADLKTNVPGKGFELTISAHRPMTTGTVQGQVVLKNASNPGQGVTIPFWANVQPAIMVFPPQITLPPGPLTAKATPTVTIQNNSTNQLAISDAAISVKDVDMQLKEMQPGRVFSAVFTFPQGFQAPQGQQVVFTAKTTNPQMPEIKVPIFQMTRPAAPRS
ncbi:MAG: DUF1573 domain-containing protein, partial [Limisphaerales bacterium]